MEAKKPTIKDLKFDKENPNQGTERGRYMLKKSFGNLGAGRSVLADRNLNLIAGNKATQAAIDEGLDVEFVHTDGSKLVVVVRDDIENMYTDPKGRELSIADNRASELGFLMDPETMAKHLNNGHIKDWMYTREEIEDELGLTPPIPDDPETEESARGSGELLELTQVTIGEPKHEVKRGEVYILADKHILIIGDVINGWSTWSPHMNDKSLFVPYPGPYVALSIRAMENRMVMVQPDTYIGGHILDRWSEIHGEQTIKQN